MRGVEQLAQPGDGLVAVLHEGAGEPAAEEREPLPVERVREGQVGRDVLEGREEDRDAPARLLRR